MVEHATRKTLKPTIVPPYRWGDWAAKSGGITGDELLACTNNVGAMRPGGERGPCQFHRL